LSSSVEAQGDPAEQALLAGLRKRDNAAFEQLIRVYGGRMLAVTTRLLKNPADAEDAVQEAFISAFRNIEKFEGNSRLSTWLHRIAVNAALMRLRKANRLGEVNLGDLLPEFSPEGFQRNKARPVPMSTLQAMEQDDLLDRVRKKIDELPDAYRTVLLLRDIEGLDTRQAAEMLGLSEAATKVRLHRARQALRTLLERSLSSKS
jgi:RNA polymerase sigma-70 factor (ECF subfamily)